MPLNIDLSRSLIKHILKKDIYIDDFIDLDIDFAKNLVWMLDNDIDDVGLDFSITTHYFGV